MSNATLGYGTKLQRGDGSTPEVFATIPEVTSDIEVGASGSTVKVTNHDGTSGWEEYIGGLKDGVEIAATANYIAGDTTQALLFEDSDDGLQRNWKIIEPGPGDIATRAMWDFTAIVTDVSVKYPVDKQSEITFKVKITSKPVFTPGTT